MGDIYYHDGFFNSNRSFNYNEACLNFKNEGLEPRFCKNPGIGLYNNVVHFGTIVIGTLSMVSSFFLLITLLVYIFLPFLRNSHGKILICHIFCLTMTFFTYANINLNPLVDIRMSYYSYNLRKFLGTLFNC